MKAHRNAGKSKKQSTLLNFLSQSQGNGTPSQSKTSGKKRKGAPFLILSFQVCASASRFHLKY